MTEAVNEARKPLVCGAVAQGGLYQAISRGPMQVKVELRSER